MTPQTLAAIMSDLAEGDPLDFSGLAIDEDNARALMAAHFCEVDRQLAASGMASEERLEFMAAIAGHMMVENMLLHLARFKGAAERTPEFRSWMRRHGLDGRG